MVARLNVAVTGASGFIGSEISDGLNLNRCNVVRIALRSQISDFIGDLQKNKFDVVIHCAGKVNGTEEDLQDSNVMLTKRIVSSLSKESNVHLIFLSTGAVYGNSINHSSVETDVLKPIDAYANSKLSAEKEVSRHHHSAILRLPSVYGVKKQ